MQRLIEDDGLRDRIGRAAREAAVARFDRGRLADPWSSVYDRASPAAAEPAAAR
jgi:hypothetical protein